MTTELQTTAAKTKLSLNLKQEEFCQLYVTGDVDFYGNGVNCYLEVYKPKRSGNWYNVAKAGASRLLTNANVIKRINELLDAEGFNEQNVDKQHLFLLNQFADLKTKLGAIREFNALKKRVDGGTSGIRTVIINLNGQAGDKHKPNEEASISLPGVIEPAS